MRSLLPTVVGAAAAATVVSASGRVRDLRGNAYARLDDLGGYSIKYSGCVRVEIPDDDGGGGDDDWNGNGNRNGNGDGNDDMNRNGDDNGDGNDGANGEENGGRRLDDGEDDADEADDEADDEVDGNDADGNGDDEANGGEDDVYAAANGADEGEGGRSGRYGVYATFHLCGDGSDANGNGNGDADAEDDADDDANDDANGNGNGADDVAEDVVDDYANRRLEDGDGNGNGDNGDDLDFDDQWNGDGYWDMVANNGGWNENGNGNGGWNMNGGNSYDDPCSASACDDSVEYAARLDVFLNNMATHWVEYCEQCRKVCGGRRRRRTQENDDQNNNWQNGNNNWQNGQNGGDNWQNGANGENWEDGDWFAQQGMTCNACSSNCMRYYHNGEQGDEEAMKDGNAELCRAADDFNGNGNGNGDQEGDQENGEGNGQLYYGPDCDDNGQLIVGTFYDDECTIPADDVRANGGQAYDLQANNGQANNGQDYDAQAWYFDSNKFAAIQEKCISCSDEDDETCVNLYEQSHHCVDGVDMLQGSDDANGANYERRRRRRVEAEENGNGDVDGDGNGNVNANGNANGNGYGFEEEYGLAGDDVCGEVKEQLSSVESALARGVRIFLIVAAGLALIAAAVAVAVRVMQQRASLGEKAQPILLSEGGALS